MEKDQEVEVLEVPFVKAEEEKEIVKFSFY